MQQQLPEMDLKKLYNFGGKYIIKAAVVIFAMPMLFFGLASYGIYFYNAGVADEIAGWHEVEATIVRSEVVKDVRKEIDNRNNTNVTNRKGANINYKTVTYYIPSLAYEYTIDGTKRLGTNYAFQGFSSTDKQEVENIVRDLQPGFATKAYYNPKDPSEVALLRKEPPSIVLRYIAMIFVLVSLVSIVIAIKI